MDWPLTHFATPHLNLLDPLRDAQQFGGLSKFVPYDFEIHDPAVSKVVHIDLHNPVKFIVSLLGEKLANFERYSDALEAFVADFENRAAGLRRSVLAASARVIPVMYEELLFEPEETLLYLSRQLDIPLSPPLPSKVRRYGIPSGIESERLAEKLRSPRLLNSLVVTTSIEQEETLAAERSVREASTAWDDGAFYKQAESWFEEHWERYLEPLLGQVDFSTSLDLACGHGRAVTRLSSLARNLHLFELSENALETTRERFGSRQSSCRLEYHKTNGTSLQPIEDGSITFLWCWDSAVHFDKQTIRRYLRESRRVLGANGVGLVHHSNFGHVQRHSYWRENPHWRSNMTAELFRSYCEEFGLQVIEQKYLDWGPWEGRTYKDLDCITLFRRMGE